MDVMDVLRAKELRGNIIEILYMRYGDEITISMLRSFLRYKGYSSNNDIPKAIDYLSGDKKEFVFIDRNKDDYEDSKVSLTPLGVNLAEGDITDVGVNIYE